MKKLLFIICTLSVVIYAKPTMSQKTYNSLMEAQKYIEQEETKKAKILLNQLLAKKNNYSSSYAYQYLATIALQENDYQKAKKYYEKIVSFNSLTKEYINKIKLSLSKIYLSLEEFNQSILVSTDLLKDSKLDKKNIYETLIYSYYYTQHFKESILYSKKYNNLSKEKKENIYQVLYSSYIELKNYSLAISTLNIMIKKWHNQKNYWLQLASLYQEKKQYKKALSIIELSYKKNVLNPKKHTKFFVNLLFQNELYSKVSTQLENAIKKGYIKENKEIFKQLISSYLNAKEFDKAIYKITNSKFSKNIKYKKILANLYYNKHNYKSTIKTLTSTNNKKLKLDGELQILLALSYYELNNTNKTQFHLKKAFHSKKKKRALQIAKALKINITS